MRLFASAIFIVCISTAFSDAPITRVELEALADGRLGFLDYEKLDRDRVSKPYLPAPLKGKSDAELIAWTQDGKKLNQLVSELVPEFNLPAEFWTDSADSIALALVDANRTASEKTEFPIAFRKAATPISDSGVLDINEGSSGCHNWVSKYWTVRWSPKESWLAFGQTWSPGVVDQPAIVSRTVFDLRWFPIPYAEARQIAGVVSALNRLSTKKTDSNPHRVGESSADGSGIINWRADNGKGNFTVEEGVWSRGQTTADRMAGPWAGDATMSFTVRITDLFRQRFADDWKKFDFGGPADAVEQARSRLAVDPRQTESTKVMAASVMKRQLSGGAPLNSGILATAVEACGDLGFTELLPLIEQLSKSLPRPTKAVTEERELDARLKKLEVQLGKNASWDAYMDRKYPDIHRAQTEPGIPAIPDLEPADSPKPKAKVEPTKLKVKPDPKLVKVDALHERHDKLRFRKAARERLLEYLRGAAPRALRQLAINDDKTALAGRIAKTGEVWWWAYRRLKELDAKLAANTLHALLAANLKSVDHAITIFPELAEVAPEQAKAIVDLLPADSRKWLSASALEKVRRDTSLPDLLAIAENPEASLERRIEAIEALVPAEDPKHFPEASVDEALRRVLVADFANDKIQSTRRSAAVALARRDAGANWDGILAALQKQDIFGHLELLTSLAMAVETNPAKYGPFFEEFIGENLVKTNFSVDLLAWVAWTANSRALKPKLEAIATSAPGDYGDSGGWGGAVRPINHRCHLARVVASIWNEEDAATRAKLIVGLGIFNAEYMNPAYTPGIRHRTELEFLAAVEKMGPDDRKQVAAFAEAAAAANKAEVGDADAKDTWLHFVRATLGSK